MACCSALGSVSPCFARTPSTIRSPRLLSTLRQYSNALRQDGFAHTVEQVTDYVVDQALSCRVVEYFADQRAGLSEVVVLGVQGVCRAHHVTVGHPVAAVVGQLGLRLGPPYEFGAYTGSDTVCTLMAPSLE